MGKIVLLVLGVAGLTWVLLLVLGRRVHSPLLRIFILAPVLVVAAVMSMQFINYDSAEQSAANTPINQVTDQTVVELGDLQVIVSGTSTLSPRQQIPLLFEGTGLVTQVLVKEGGFVEAGMVLAKLDTVDLEAALREAQNTLDLQRAAFDALTTVPRDVDIEAARAALAAAQAAFNAASLTGPNAEQVEIARLQSELARNQLWQVQLQRDGATTAITLNPINPDDIPQNFQIPQTIIEDVNEVIDGINLRALNLGPVLQLESAVTQADYGVQIADANYGAVLNNGPDYGALSSANAARIQAEIALDRLVNGPSERDVRLAEIDLQIAQLALEQAQASLNKMVLTAPFSGIIAQNNLTVGEPPPNGPALLLIDSSSYHIDLPIDETDIVNVEEGQTALVIFDALPGVEIVGRVTQLALTPVRIGQLVTYRVRVLLDPTTQPVRVGMSATARIIVNELENVPVLRNRFIRIDRSTQRAFVVVQRADGIYQEVEVVLGLRNETHSQIVDGLAVGAQVVLLPRDTFNPIPGR